jgi:hypothetical protein
MLRNSQFVRLVLGSGWTGCVGDTRNGYKVLYKNVGIGEKIILKCIS